MALRLRRDVQKASYYVWFLGAEEAKGLRGERVINSVLPYLIDRSRGQEPLKVTLQVSHKGIKILQGSSKHFIPHSAITSSVQTDDIVACVLLLYNPATKCPLHVHAYRCDSETTAETLHQQLQILINRPDNQKRFEELETRLGILPQLPTSGNKSTSASHIGKEAAHSQKPSSHFQSQQKQKGQQQHQHQQKQKQQQQQQQQQQQRRQDTSPKRFSSSLGSDTGNSTRESECSEENSNASPISRSPPTIVKPSPLPQPTNELFDSLAAELRAKLNGNGPPILLPPRDYDTVHRSKGNLTAIELRRCRNALIVGGATPTKSNANGKQVSSRGSSGIGSDLAPSPERQELNSSSDDEHWSNEADNSVIALKPSQIAMERTAPTIIPHHPQLNRKIAVKPPEDSYLRDLPAKPYTPRPHGQQSNSARDVRPKPQDARDCRSKTPSAASSWSREDEIKPIIVRPIDYDAKFHRVLQNEEQKPNYNRRPEINSKLHDTDKYNEINRLLNKKLIVDHDAMEQVHPRYSKHKSSNDPDDYVDSELPSDNKLLMRKENLTDKQKFLEYSSKKQQQQQQKSYAAEEVQKYGGRHRYVDPADLPFDTPQPSSHNKYAAVHRSNAPHSPNRSDLGQRAERREVIEPERRRRGSREREPETDRYARSSERNPYREPESIPYIQSMEKMMKSSAMRYKSYDGIIDGKDDGHSKISQRSKTYPKHEEEMKRERDYKGFPSREESRYNDNKEKIRPEYRSKRRGSMEPVDRPQVYHQEWSEEERRDDSPAPLSASNRSRTSRSGDRWEHDINEVLPQRQPTRRDYARDAPSSKHNMDHRRDEREHDDTPERYREHRRFDSRPHERESQRDNHYRLERPRDNSRDYPRDHARRDYSPDTRSGSDFRPQYVPEKQNGGAAAISSAKSLSNLAKGYRHSYAEPVFARGRVGLAAVNPY